MNNVIYVDFNYKEVQTETEWQIDNDCYEDEQIETSFCSDDIPF